MCSIIFLHSQVEVFNFRDRAAKLVYYTSAWDEPAVRYSVIAVCALVGLLAIVIPVVVVLRRKGGTLELYIVGTPHSFERIIQTILQQPFCLFTDCAV